MTNEALAVSEPWGHLTEEEQLDLVQEARRRWDESLAVAREEGREEGQRAELLRLLLNLSGDAEAASLATASVEELRAAVEDFTGRRRR